MKKVLKWIIISLLVIIVVSGIVFVVYVSDYDRATEQAVMALNSTEYVSVKELDDYIVYKPVDEIKVGLLFYPGGKIEPTVYSRVFSKLAENGVQTVVVKMPFNLAMFNINGADKVLEKYKDIDTWYFGGHSLGGVFGTEYLKDNTERFKGMIYMASYPNSDISNSGLAVLSMNATLDTVLNRSGYENAKALLPQDTIYYNILGGNHTQFGDYNLQSGDTAATITAEEQQIQIVEEVLNFMGIN